MPVAACRDLGAGAVIAVNPNARRDGRIWQPPPPRNDRDLKEALRAMLPEGLRALVAPGDPQPQPPSYLAVVSGAIDILTEQLRRCRLREDPPELALGARLEDLSVLAFAEAPRAIAEGQRMVAEAAPRIRALLQG